MVISITEHQPLHGEADLRIFDINIDNTHITTKLTGDPGTVNEWIEHVLAGNRDALAANTLIFGIAVQPTLLHRLHGATLTLCCNHDCLIIPLWRPQNGSDQLNFLFEDSSITYACASEPADIRARLSHRGLALDMDPCMLLNVRGLSLGFAEASMPTIARDMAGISVENYVMVRELSDWEENLSLDQVKHATLEAFVPWVVGNQYWG